MIVITKVGFETITAIKEGHDTNEKLARALGGQSEKYGSRVFRLRAQGLVRALRLSKEGRIITDQGPFFSNTPLKYVVQDMEYRVDDRPLAGRIPKDAKIKLYRDTGEATYDSLNHFIYPPKLAEKLNDL